MSPAYKPEGLVFGLILIALGALWTLSNLGRLDLVQTLRTWWPVSLVLWGVLELAGALLRRQSGRS